MTRLRIAGRRDRAAGPGVFSWLLLPALLLLLAAAGGGAVPGGGPAASAQASGESRPGSGATTPRAILDRDRARHQLQTSLRRQGLNTSAGPGPHDQLAGDPVDLPAQRLLSVNATEQEAACASAPLCARARGPPLFV
ncbi:hypothetical protein [Stappia indica]|uniref:hypothetical protein n=1 Tax=Stappia indica TaxID=538381 RepID=UPI000BE399B3|nr:hypothetical protein [Stappia indica]